MNAAKGPSSWAAPSVLPQKWLSRVFLLRLGQGFAIIMPTEETALRFLRAAVAARFHKNGSFEPLLWNSAICCHADFHGSAATLPWKVDGFGTVSSKNLTLEQSLTLQAKAFKVSGLAPYAL